MQAENQSNLQDANYWQQHVDQFQQYKQSKLSYCRQHDLTYHRFLYWFSKLTGDNQQMQPVSSLIPLKLSKKIDKNDKVASFTLGNGLTISIYQEDVLFNLIQHLS
jgi:hypothetical protein